MKKYKVQLNTKNDLFLTGEKLLRMDVKNALEAKDFFIAANNYAAQLTTSKEYLDKISSYAYVTPTIDTTFLEKTLLDTHNRIASSMSSVTIPSGLSDSIFRTTKTLNTLNIDALENGLATVLGFAQAVNESPLLKSLPHDGVFFPWDDDMPKLSGGEENLIPYDQKLHDIKIDGIVTIFPDIAKEIPVQRIGSTEIIEYIFRSNADDDNTERLIKIGDIKKAYGVVNLSLGYEHSQSNQQLLSTTKKPVRSNKKITLRKQSRFSESEHIEYDATYGKLFFKQKNCDIRSSSMMPHILKILFSQPEKSKEVQDILVAINLDDMTSDRSVSDCIRNINIKMKGIGINTNIFSCRNGKILTDENFLSKLRIKGESN